MPPVPELVAPPVPPVPVELVDELVDVPLLDVALVPPAPSPGSTTALPPQSAATESATGASRVNASWLLRMGAPCDGLGPTTHRGRRHHHPIIRRLPGTYEARGFGQNDQRTDA